MNILSIQSWVSYGHVGNASAVFPLQRLGAEVWAINTVQFSNHTGYGDWKGRSTPASRCATWWTASRPAARWHAATRCCPATSATPISATRSCTPSTAARRANPAALYCCDPVIGDTDTGVYVRPGIEEFLRDQALPAADIATPNRFEIERLTGSDCATLHGAKQAVLQLRADAARQRAGLRAADQPGDRHNAGRSAST